MQREHGAVLQGAATVAGGAGVALIAGRGAAPDAEQPSALEIRVGAGFAPGRGTFVDAS